MEALTWWLFALTLISVSVLVSSTKLITEGNEALVERSGRYHRKLTPGLNFGIIPLVDKVVVQASISEQYLDIRPGEYGSGATTLDNVRVVVDAVIFWRIFDLEKAWYRFVDVEEGIKILVIAVLQSQISRMNLQETNSERNRIVRALLEGLDEATEPWGVKITRVEMQDIKLASDAPDLISLPLPEGVNWKAIEQSLLIVIEQEDIELKVQSISQRDDGVMVIQVKVPSDANKEKILEELIRNYESSVQAIEARYRAELRGKEEQLSIYRQHYSTLEGFIHTLANRPPALPPITIETKATSGNQQTGNNTEDRRIGEVTMANEGDTYSVGQAGAVGRYARSDNNTFYQSEQKQTLAEAAREIQQLLKQLEQTNPTATEAEKIAYVNDETTPSFKRRAVSALQAGGEAAIEEFLDNPYVNVGKAIVKGWMKPE
jgi:regulator of protease activity HflC (stomatin/prohibitin superfamily)